jgi:hypothetical protein
MNFDNDDEIGSLERMARDKIRQRQAAEAANNPLQGQDIAFVDLLGALRGAPINRNRGPGGSWPGAANAGAAYAAPANWNCIPAVSAAGAGAGGSVTNLGSVAVFGRANCCTLEEIVQDKVIVRNGD